MCMQKIVTQRLCSVGMVAVWCEYFGISTTHPPIKRT